MKLNFNEAQLSNGAKIQTIDLNSKQYEVLLKQESLNLKRVYNSITTEDSSIIIYEISDGNILVSSDGYYSVYRNMDDLLKVIGDYDYDGTEILFNRNNYNSEFPKFTKTLINDLYKSLDCNLKENELYSLNIICEKIKKKDNLKAFNKEKMLNYIALVGEIIISEYGGKWVMVLSEDNKTWNPYLIINGNKIDIMSFIYEDVIENNSEIRFSYNSIVDIINLKKNQ